MGFNKLWLPEINSLKEQLLRVGVDEFTQHWIRRYEKSDAIIGSIESTEFIKQFIENEYEKNNVEST